MNGYVMPSDMAGPIAAPTMAVITCKMATGQNDWDNRMTAKAIRIGLDIARNGALAG